MKLINPIIGSKDINNNFVKKKKGTRIHISVEATFDYFILCNENPPKKRLWTHIFVKWVEKMQKNIVSSSTALADNVCKCHTQFTVVMQTDIWIKIHRLISQAPFGLQGAFIPL